MGRGLRGVWVGRSAGKTTPQGLLRLTKLWELGETTKGEEIYSTKWGVPGRCLWVGRDERAMNDEWMGYALEDY